MPNNDDDQHSIGYTGDGQVTQIGSITKLYNCFFQVQQLLTG